MSLFETRFGYIGIKKRKEGKKLGQSLGPASLIEALYLRKRTRFPKELLLCLYSIY